MTTFRKRPHWIWLSALSTALVSLGLTAPALAQEIDPDEFNQRLQTCTPSVTEIPSLLTAFGVDTINRMHILGEKEGRCSVDYTFAYPEQPEQEAIYLSCQYSDETIAQMVNSAGEAVSLDDECTFNENWMNEI